jgi:hypothetical protein
MKSLCCLCVCVIHRDTNTDTHNVCPLIFDRQRFGKCVTAETNTQETIDELFGALFSMRTVLYQRKVGE